MQRGTAPIGVDIGAGGVHLLQLRLKAGKPEVVAAARFDRRAGDTEEIPLTERMLEGIRRKIESGAFTGRECVMTFPDHWLAARSVRLPVMSREERDAALEIEAAERLGFTDETPGEVSWISAGRVRQGDETREEIILLGAERAPLTELVDLLATTGLRPTAVEPSMLATARAYSRRHRRESDKDVVRVGLDIGRRNTGVIVLRGGDVAFYKPLRVSGNDFTRAVADKLDITDDSAADLRAQRLAATWGGARPCEQSVDRAVFDAVRPLIDELAKETALCLRYFTVAFTGLRPIEVFTTGSEASEPRLAETLGEALRLEHGVGSPLSGIAIDPKARLGHASSPHTEWAGALGLSLRGLPETKRSAASEDGEPAEIPQTRADEGKSAA
jgi:type IV pilus assembly protein PilM